jgi:hypothetical protein
MAGPIPLIVNNIEGEKSCYFTINEGDAGDAVPVRPETDWLHKTDRQTDYRRRRLLG